MGKYYDIPSVMQVIGGVFANPNLLDMEDKYHFYEEDFDEDFHKILFGSIFNLHQLGAKEISITTIENYLEQKPKKYAVYVTNKGSEYLQKLSENTQFSAFDYYYTRVKKMTLLRMYHNVGMNLSWIYDTDNILDVKKRQLQEEWLDAHSLEEIADTINKKVDDIRLKYVDNNDGDFCQAGKGIKDLIGRFDTTPEVGYPLYGPMINGIHRGARLKKLYVRSAATGVGKTRAMIADACNIACDKIYDEKAQKWVSNGTKEPTLFIATEQDEEEVQTMMLAFLSAVDEGHIITGNYVEGERDRVWEASNILEESPLYVKKLPDFSLQDIENCIKYAIREWDCRYIFFDYLHSSMKILSEIGNKSGVKGLREDNILFLISVRLKDLCNQYGVFIMTSTQLNASYVDADVYDQNLLRGAKSIADKIDFGSIMLEVTEEDREALGETISKMGVEMPDIKMSIYKNRRGAYNNLLLWCKAKRGICRFEPLFATNYRKELVKIDDINIKVKPRVDASAF